MALAKSNRIKAPVSSGDVIKYLVQSEPLSLVTGISSYVDLCSSERRQRCIAREPSNALIEGGELVVASVDHLLDEVQDLHATVEKLLKEADNVVTTRFRDLQDVAALLHSNPPLTTPPMIMGTDPLAQMTSKVEKIVTVQDGVRNSLEVGRDSIEAALYAISNRGGTLKLFLGLLLERTPNLPGGDSHWVEFKSLCDRYQRRSQYLLTVIERVAENSKVIHDLALSLERDRSSDISIPLRAQAITLAEELSGLDMWRTSVIAPPQFDLPLGVVQINSQGVDRISSLTQLRLVGIAYLLALFTVFNVALRLRFHTGSLSHTITPQATFKSIRDLLLEGRTSISDELIHNLVPKRM